VDYGLASLHYGRKIFQDWESLPFSVAFGDYGNGWCSPTGNAKELHDRHIFGLEHFINIARRGHQSYQSCLSITSTLVSAVCCLSLYENCSLLSNRCLPSIVYLKIRDPKSTHVFDQLCWDASGLAVVLSLWRVPGVHRLIPAILPLPPRHTLSPSPTSRSHNRCVSLCCIGRIAQLKRLLCDTTTGMSYSSPRIHKYPYKNLRLPATMFTIPVSNSLILHVCCDRSWAG
jgi:hypothetical protein